MNTTERCVIKDNEFLELTTKTFDVLQFLIENAGNVVTKDEILGHVWNGNVVEESNLPVHISRLRKSLDERTDRRFIETVQGSGYRFVAPVKSVGEPDWKRALSYGGGSDEHSWQVVNNVRALVVLPFRNEALDVNADYLCDGITEGLINDLSHVEGIKVISRNTSFAYKDREVDPKDVGRDLRVSMILSGRVRVVGKKLLVSAELTEAENGIHVWGGRYDRTLEDVVGSQRDIVEAVSQNLKLAPPSDPHIFRPTHNAESYKLYLMGKYLLAKRTASKVRKAIEYLHESVFFDATNIHAYVAIIDAYHFLYVLETLPRKETLEMIKRPLALLSSLNQAVDVLQLCYGKLKLYLDWNHEAAKKHFRKALALNPNLVDAHYMYAQTMIIEGNKAEARSRVKEILRLDPMSLPSLKGVGRIYYMLGQYAESKKYLDDALELEPSDFETLIMLGATFIEIGNYQDGLKLLNKSYHCQGGIEALAMIGYAEARRGNIAAAVKVIERLTSKANTQPVPANHIARIYAVIGDNNRTYEYLDKAYEEHAGEMYALSYDPRWNGIRTETRFTSFIQKVWSAPKAIE